MLKIKSLNMPIKVLKSKNKETILDYNKYIEACQLIANDIKEKYDLEHGEIELVGLARGGLPLLVTISHLLNIRRISIIQTQMSNSDNCHDYGEVRYISDNLDDVKRNCILLEDIIYKGKTTNEAINIAKSKNKNVIGVYSLIIDEKFKTIEIENNDVPINYVYEILADHWIYFFWETDIRKMKEGGEIND